MQIKRTRRVAGSAMLFLIVALMSLLIGSCSGAAIESVAGAPGGADAGGESGGAGANIDLTRGDWRLWLDTSASWRNDELYLPDQVDLAKLPVSAPTGGWSALSGSAGIPVTLPGTVEEHYWARSLNPAATADQIVNANGSYIGVSWWYCNFTAPALAAGERCEIHFRGTRLRAEVYVNQKLVGYNIITELPFTVDATPALKPGAGNQLAIRITNPGGQLAWDDNGTIRWGNYVLPMSHGFGGVDGGVQLSVRGPVHVSDLTVLNTPDPATVAVSAEVTSMGRAYRGPVSLSVRRGSQSIYTTTVDADVPAGGSVTVSRKITVPAAELWDIYHPSLYEADARVPGVALSDRQTTFGCRWFAPTGIGSDAKLQMNGRRIVVKSSISWGFWAPNGMFPDEAAVAREVASVEALGLNSIQNHRHMPKEVVLEGFDQAGLLRYCEPGAGVQSFNPRGGPPGAPRAGTGPIDNTGSGGEPKSFTARYEMFKTLGMVKSFRSHPSVSVWTLQNETSPDLHNPSIFWMIRKMHEIDPSRTVLLKSGVDPRNQVLMEPYSDQVRSSDASNFSGWWDQHTAEDSKGEYIDSMYNSPTDFEYRSENKREIVAWGEMATGASPDDHTAVARWYAQGNKPGYDRLAAETIRDGYQKFIDTYGFSSVFPTPEPLFLEAGNKHYFSAARILENARICDPIDYVVLSGWESTIIDNHSGMTDALRQLKGDPAPLKRAGADQVLVLRPRNYVVAKGQPIVFDVHLINEHKRQGPQELTVSGKGPGGEALFGDAKATMIDVPGGDVYGQLLQQGYTLPAATPGTYTLTARLRAASGSSDLLERTEQVLVIDPAPSALAQRIAYVDDSDFLGQLLRDRFHADAAPLASAGDASRILLCAEMSAARTWHAARTRVFGPAAAVPAPVAPADPSLDPQLFTAQMEGPPAGLVKLPVANGKAQVDLYFGGSTRRAFDVALNGQTVLHDLNPAAEAGGGGFVRHFDVAVTNGNLTLSVPSATQGLAAFAAIRVSDAQGVVTRRVFRADAFTDRLGDTWEPVKLLGTDLQPALDAVLPRVRDGARLILVTGNDQGADIAGQALAKAGLVDFGGVVTRSGPSWFGAWYFGRKHWLLDGLPADCVWDWQYQADSGESDGMLLSGHNIEGIVGFSKAHSATIGFGVATIPVGKGQIVVFCLPGLMNCIASPTGSYRGFHPVTGQRLLFNALK